MIPDNKNQPFHISNRKRYVFSICLLLLFGFSTLIPYGYMPVQTDNGHFTVSLCGAAGPVSMQLDEAGQWVPFNTHAATESQENNHSKPCVFSTVGISAFNSFSQLFKPSTGSTSINVSIATVTFVTQPTLSILGARAPPSLNTRFLKAIIL